MRTRLTRLGAFCLGVVLTVSGSAARADFSTPTYTFSTNTLTTNWGYDTGKGIATPPKTLWGTYTGPDGVTVVDPTKMKNPLQAPQFNPNDPTIVAAHDPSQTAVLTGVSIAMTYSLHNSFVYNYVNNTGISVRADGSITYSLPSSTPLPFATAPTFHNGYNPDNTPYYRPFNPATDKLNTDIAVNNGILTGFATKTFSSNGVDPVSAQYVGSSVIQVPILAFATSAFDSQSGNGTGRSITDAQFSFSIHYTYKLVPEPSAITLAMIGGAASLFFFRRRRSAA